MLLQQFFERTARRLGQKVALVDRNGCWSYAQLEEKAARIATAMGRAGVRRGDRVAIYIDNCAHAVVAIFAILKAGAVFVPINAQTKAAKLRTLLDHVQASCLFTHASLERNWREALVPGSSVRACIVVGAPSYDQALLEPRFAGDLSTIDQDLASIIFTSGSTKAPKGVMLSHLNMASALRSVNAYLGYREDDVIQSVLPLTFSYGLYQVLLSAMVGATVVLEAGFAYPAMLLESMKRYSATVLPGVPTLFAQLLARADARAADLPSLRIITSASAPLPEDHIGRLRRLFPQAKLYSMYGLTECKRASYLPPDQLDARPGSVGRGMPNQEHWLEDEAGRRLPNGSVGELVVRGSHVMRGYWQLPRETAEHLRPGPSAGERVLHTGDLFRSDAEGYLYFVARKDDIIKSRGEKVSPREVEEALCSFPGVLEAAAVGVADPLLGQAVKAYVVLAQGQTQSAGQIIGHCMTRLENFMVPKHIEFVASLPKSENGKVRRSWLARGAPQEERVSQGETA